jgi:hypothetical protein
VPSSAEDTLRSSGHRRVPPTFLGRIIDVRFPLLPRHSRVIVEAMMNHPEVLEEVLIAVSFLSTKTPFLLIPGEEEQSRAAHKRFNNSEYGDFVSYLNIYRQYTANTGKEAKQKFCKRSYLDFQGMQEIVHVNEQLGEICSDIGFPISSGGTVREYLSCIASGLCNMYAQAKGNSTKADAVQVFILPEAHTSKRFPIHLAGEIVQTASSRGVSRWSRHGG